MASIRRNIEDEARVVEIIASMRGKVNCTTSVQDIVIYFAFWHSEQIHYVYEIKDYKDIENLTAVCEAHNKEIGGDTGVVVDENDPIEQEVTTLDSLIGKIETWGMDRGIIQNGKPQSQAVKALEELHEIFDAILRDDQDDIKDGIGDLIVAMIMLAGIRGLTIDECITAAYEEIKDRTGYLRKDGIFVKDEESRRPR